MNKIKLAIICRVESVNKGILIKNMKNPAKLAGYPTKCKAIQICWISREFSFNVYKVLI
jgi:hypothetical protein